MFSPKTKINSFLKIDNNNNQHFKIMKLFFKFINISMGLDFGFFHSKTSKFNVIIKIGSFIHCLTVTTICWMYHEKSILSVVPVGKFYLFSHVMESFILLLFRNGTTFYDFNIDIQSVDSKMRVSTESYKCEIRLIFVMLYFLSSRVIAIAVHCYLGSLYCLQPSWLNLFFLIESASFIYILVVNAAVFYGINRRLLKLHAMVAETSDYDNLLKLYQSIARLSEKYKSAFDPSIVYALLATISQVMSLIYFRIAQIRAVDFLTFRAEYAIVAENLVLLFGPPIVAGFMNNTAKKIIIELHDKLSCESDHTKRNQITSFISYIEARPMKFKIWGLLPLNAKFLTIVLNFCVTYLIVIVQFTLI